MSYSIELKPCPFCGAKAYFTPMRVEWFDGRESEGTRIVAGHEPGCVFHMLYWGYCYGSVEEAAEAWNQRSGFVETEQNRKWRKCEITQTDRDLTVVQSK